jgi:TolB-like protein/tetratricopeptide (TPR) repeat protein
MSAQPSFFSELQRRHVYKVGAMYGVAGWLLVQIATQVFPFFDISNAAVRWVVIAVVAGFVPALVLAWLFDLTPQGIVRTGELPVTGETPVAAVERRGMERKLNILLGGLLVLALAYVGLEHSVLRRDAMPVAATSATAAEKSIAVLPLVNGSGDSANEYFSDGLTEEMIAILGKIPDLKLIGRGSSFHFKNSSEDSKAIGEKLGVANLLEGSVQKQGERVRIVAELINAADGRTLWSETYDRELKDVFAVQTEIATAVAEQLKLKLLGGSAALDALSSTRNLDAQNAMLQGDFYFQKFSEAGMRQAIAAYQEAVRLDPRYALAYVKLALAWRQLAASWLGGAEGIQANAQAHQAAQTALTLAPDLGRAHEALGWVLLTADFDTPRAAQEFQRALELSPGDPEVIQALAYMQAVEGRLPQAEATGRAALASDPLALPPYLNLARILIAMGRYDEADVYLRKALELQPGAARTHAYLTVIDARRGDARSALEHAGQEPPGFWRDYALALAQQLQGDAAADAALQKFIAGNDKNGPFQVATVYGLRKDPDRMFQWLDRAYEERDPGLPQLTVMPFIRDYRTDPRFAALCARLKITLQAEPPA